MNYKARSDYVLCEEERNIPSKGWGLSQGLVTEVMAVPPC